MAEPSPGWTLHFQRSGHCGPSTLISQTDLSEAATLESNRMFEKGQQEGEKTNFLVSFSLSRRDFVDFLMRVWLLCEKTINWMETDITFSLACIITKGKQII